jgi:hypothetical protein
VICGAQDLRTDPVVMGAASTRQTGAERDLLSEDGGRGYSERSLVARRSNSVFDAMDRKIGA